MDPARGLILAGGDGATALTPVANKPVLVHGLEAMRAAGITQVAVAVDPSARDSVRAAVTSAGELGADVTYVETDPGRGLLAAVGAAADFLGDAGCVAHQGDGLLRHDIRRLVDEVSRGAADALLLVHPDDGAPAALDDSRLLRAVGCTAGRGTRVALAGVHVFGPRVVRELARRPGNAPEALAQLARTGGRARTVEVDGCWRRVTGPDELLEANRLVLDELDQRPVDAELDRCSVQGRAAIDPSARLEKTVVRGPAVIGAGAVLRDAYIGPYTSIGDGVLIEGAEIEHSIVLPKARIEHVGARLEASVVGQGAHVHRDFRVPRALRLRVGDGAEISLV